MSAPATAVDMADLKSRNPLPAAVEAAGVELRGRGRVRQGLCPFHSESEGSFTVYADEGRWWCFGCGEGGDVVDFVRRTRGVGFPEAVRILGAGAVISAPAPRLRPPAPREPELPWDRAALTAAARFYAARLRESPEARAYLLSRGIGPGPAARLGLGYAPGGGLRAHMEAAGFDRGRLARAGLLCGRIERFAGMIVVPDLAAGSVRWMAGRAVDPGAAPRFQAPPGPKPVLGLARLGAAPAWVVLAEGVFDWVALASWGLPACAALGTHGERRVAAALRGCARVFLALDSDDAGRAAAERYAALLGPRAVPLALPDGVGDAADLARLPDGRRIFTGLLRTAARAAR